MARTQPVSRVTPVKESRSLVELLEELRNQIHYAEAGHRIVAGSEDDETYAIGLEAVEKGLTEAMDLMGAALSRAHQEAGAA